MGKRKISRKNYAEVSSEDEDSKSSSVKNKKDTKHTLPEEPVSSDDSECENKMSEYELLRLRNIQERDRLLRSLGIDEAIKELNEISPSVRPKSVKKTPRVKIEKEPLPRREPSRRIRNLAAASINKIKEEIEEEQEFEEKDDRFYGSYPMKAEDNESEELLKRLKDIKDERKFDPDVNLESCDLQSFQTSMSFLQMAYEPTKVVPKRIQSIYTHPTTAKHLVIAGDVSGHLGLWDIGTDHEGSVATLRPHRGPINCISVSKTDSTKIFTTAHDGAFVCGDLEQNLFSNVYATDFSERIQHLTWHDQVDAHRILLTHGNGKVGVLDLRSPNAVDTWIPCFDRSARTVNHHPIQDNYFLVASGAGSSCNVYDIRTCSNNKAVPLSEMSHPKGLTSAFFSPSGNYVLSTCNDDNLRIFTSLLEIKPNLKKMIPHNNHTGRWLSVFKAVWHPVRDDAFMIGSLLFPRRIQFYGLDGKLIVDLRNEEMTTISPVICAHPTLPFIVGGNSSGRVHAFTYSSNK